MSKRIESIKELEAKGFVRQSDGSYRKQRLCANQREPACHPGCMGNKTENRPSEPEAKRGDLAGAVDGVRANAGSSKALCHGTRIRQSKKPLLNRLESEWFRQPEAEGFLPQAVRFRLGNGIWYKPDGFNPNTKIAVEVKGPHAFRGGFENLKVAASLYPMIRWRLVWKQDGQWMEQEVLP